MIHHKKVSLFRKIFVEHDLNAFRSTNKTQPPCKKIRFTKKWFSIVITHTHKRFSIFFVGFGFDQSEKLSSENFMSLTYIDHQL